MAWSFTTCMDGVHQRVHVLVPVEIKAIEKGQGHVLAVLFSIATAIVFLAYLPLSVRLFGLALPLLPGFYAWEFSMIMAAALFARTLWKSSCSPAPVTFLTVLLLLLPIQRTVWTFEPEPPKHAAAAPQPPSPQVET